MMHRRRFLSAATLTSAALALPAIAKAPRLANPDLRLLGDILRTLHPGLHRYLAPDAFERGLARLDADWTAKPTLDHRYLSLSRFLATLRCGHSYANFFNQKRAVATALFDRPTRLPFAFRWIGQSMVVLRDQSGTGKLPPGTIVKAVNGVPAQEMLTRLLPYARADGHNLGKRRALLGVSGADKIEFFDVFHGLLFGPLGSKRNEAAPGFHRLQVRLPGTAHDLVLDLPALTLRQRQQFVHQTAYDGDQPVWDWSVAEAGVATLTMDGWALFNSKWDWQSWLNDRLSSLKGAKGLIVDLRENEGGNDCGDLILARLAGKDLPRPKAEHLVRYRKVPAALNPNLDTWDDSFRDWGDDAVPYDAEFFRLNRWRANGVLAAQGPKVSVPMAVLTSPQNSSATFQFASMVKATRLGTLIGSVTGGNQRGINGSAFFFARLPESDLEFDVPLVGIYPEGSNPDAGITPDIAVENSAADIAADHDRVLETAAAWLVRQ